MKINFKKTKMMLFNTHWSKKFMPKLNVGNNEVELVDEMKLLGVVIRSDVKWTSNTKQIVSRGYKKLLMLIRLNFLGSQDQLKDVYIKHIRSVLELDIPAWYSSITQAENTDIERVQKAAFSIILDNRYESYINSLQLLEMESLENRRVKLCLKFGRKAEKHSKFTNWFELSKKTKTRLKQDKYCGTVARTTRLMKSSIPYLTDLLNQDK